MKRIILCLGIIACSNIIASEIHNPLGVLVGGEREFTIAQKWLQQEREYEGNSGILDERDYASWATNVGIGFGIWRGFSVKAKTEFTFSGELKKSFNSSIPLENQKVDYSGPSYIALSLQYYSSRKELVFEVFGETYIERARDRNSSIGSTNGGMALKYLHQLESLAIHGKVFVQVNGKRRVYRSDGEREITDPYTKFGNELNFRYDFNHLWLNLGGHFFLATDFVTRSPSYNRSSDKGFGVGGIFEIGYRNGAWGIRSWHKRSSDVFNVIPEESSEQREFEIEDQSSGVELTWRW